ncbi:hypothetical protein [Histidinibacterium lentulum]|uniref:Uncharacterized protein n=1 Tax=Histidinibacterium lentulum TaxID=2480588 RepID=A0A3N2R9M9_9RHOB|nr:hypothetical protein [Histidinibacterium lentulum]ROU04117.1 hypothetical protein EAT49_01590 [Histidinibacterium lentulum]
MAHYPRPGPGRRLALAVMQAAGFALAIFAALVFRSNRCAIGAAGSDFALWPPQRFQLADLSALALLFALFLLFTVPTVRAGPGPRSRRLKRSFFALFVAGLAIAVVAGPTPTCDTGLTPLGAAAVIAAIGLGLRLLLVQLAGHDRKT